MPRGYWRIILTAVGVVTLILLGGVTAQLYHASEQQYSEYDYQPASHPGFVQLVPSKARPQGYKPNCQNPQTKEDADLCAQWAGVQQTAEANRMGSLNLKFAIASLWATAIATLLLVSTLIETRNTARIELRAYVFVEMAGIADGTHLPDRDPARLGAVSSVVIIKNTGATPATRVVHWSALEIASFKDEAKLRAPSALDEASASSVPPQGTINVDRHQPRKATKRQIAAIAAGTSGVFVYGAVEYWDVFNRKHRTNYRLHFSGSWPPPENPRMGFSASGNDFT